MSHIYEKALQKYSQFNPNKGTLANWIFGIAKNCLKNHYREQNRIKYILDQVNNNDVLLLFENSSNPEAEFEKNENIEKIVQAIRFLPKQEQDVLALRYWAGFSYAEIAEQLKISPSTVGVSLHRSHKKLKGIIALEEVRIDA